MSKIIQCKTFDGDTVEFVDEIIGSGAMKDIYFSPDKSYVVGFYKTPQDAQAKERLQMITSKYRQNIFGQIGGDYWKSLFCWPTAMLEWNGRLGLVAPTYGKDFFFQFGSRDNDKLQIKGKEKEGKWFTAASLRSKFIDQRELGNWLNYVKICLLLARAMRRMHMTGLAHVTGFIKPRKNGFLKPRNMLFPCIRANRNGRSRQKQDRCSAGSKLQ
jgi:hypothetical protein